MRYFHGGRKAEEVKEIGGTIYGGMEKGNDPDRPEVLKYPPMAGGREVPLKPGGIAFSIFHGEGRATFYHLAPGEYADIGDEIPVRTVKSLAPQLLTKDEAMKAGLCHEDGSPRSPKKTQPSG